MFVPADLLLHDCAIGIAVGNTRVLQAFQGIGCRARGQLGLGERLARVKSERFGRLADEIFTGFARFPAP
ncbi:hypothetical protein ACFQEX_09175 [Roseibium salinum]|uniref:hypothetical protein n=1 Tax=Roseibium salinum TaxID=1604349 RepID=UPI00361D5F24